MKFSAQEEYGIRCMIAIARRGSCTISEIARGEGLTEAHVAKILAILRRGGLVQAARGQSGGYSLGRPAEQITAAEIVTVLGGRLIEEDFCDRHTGKQAVCAHSGGCNIRGLWDRVQEAVDEVLVSVTLAEICQSEEQDARVVMAVGPPQGVRGRGAQQQVEFPVTLTPEAHAHLKRWLQRKGSEGSFIRIGVKGGGCKGFEYVVRIDEKRLAIDLASVIDGLEVAVDGKSAPILMGSVVRYTGNLLGGGGLQFENPNAARSCGCGTSFTLKAKA